MVRSAVAVVLFVTVMLLGVIPGPASIVIPATKFVPVSEMFTVSPRTPDVGLIVLRVGV
jgi:hypothetical protein